MFKSIDPLKRRFQLSNLRILLWDIDGTLLRSTQQGSFKVYFASALEKTFGTSGKINEVAAAGITDTQIVFQALQNNGFTMEKISARMSDFLDNLCADMKNYLAAHENVYEILPGIKNILDAAVGNPNFTNALLTGNVACAAKLKTEYVGVWNFFENSPNAFGEISHDRRELAIAAGKLFSERYDYEFQPAQFIVIGDTPFDVDCARNFGAKIIAVATGRGIKIEDLRAAEPDYLLEDLSDTAEVLRILATI